VALCCNIGVFERLGNVHSDLGKTDLFGILARCMYAGIKERASKSPRDAALACRISKGASHWPPRIISGVIEHTHWLIDDTWMRVCNPLGSACEIAQHTILLYIILLHIAVAFPSARIHGVESSLYLHVPRAYWLTEAEAGRSTTAERSQAPVARHGRPARRLFLFSRSLNLERRQGDRSWGRRQCPRRCRALRLGSGTRAVGGMRRASTRPRGAVWTALRASKLLGKRKPRLIMSGAISQFCRQQLVSSWLEVRRVQRERETAASARTASRLCDGGAGVFRGRESSALAEDAVSLNHYCRFRRASVLAAWDRSADLSFFQQPLPCRDALWFVPLWRHLSIVRLGW
jgi:hypothetical protein